MLAHDAFAAVDAAAAQHFGEGHEVGCRKVQPHAAERDAVQGFPERLRNPQRAEKAFLQIIGQRYARTAFHCRRADTGCAGAVQKGRARLVRHWRLQELDDRVSLQHVRQRADAVSALHREQVAQPRFAHRFARICRQLVREDIGDLFVLAQQSLVDGDADGNRGEGL